MVEPTGGPESLAMLLWLHVSQAGQNGLIVVPHHRPDQSSKSKLLQQLQSELAVGKCDSLHEDSLWDKWSALLKLCLELMDVLRKIVIINCHIYCRRLADTDILLRMLEVLFIHKNNGFYLKTLYHKGNSSMHPKHPVLKGKGDMRVYKRWQHLSRATKVLCNTQW